MISAKDCSYNIFENKETVIETYFRVSFCFLHIRGTYSIQLDLPSETDTLIINLPHDREGYDESKTTYEKLSARKIQLCGDPSSIFYFFFTIFGAWITAQLDEPCRKL